MAKRVISWNHFVEKGNHLLVQPAGKMNQAGKSEQDTDQEQVEQTFILCRPRSGEQQERQTCEEKK